MATDVAAEDLVALIDGTRAAPGAVRNRRVEWACISAVLVVVGALVALLIHPLTKALTPPHNTHKVPSTPTNNTPHDTNNGTGTAGKNTWCGSSLQAPSYMPPGCPNEPAPKGPRYQWGALDISSSQPPYQASAGACGGSCGAQPLGVTQQVLVCPPGKVVQAGGDYSLSATYTTVHSVRKRFVVLGENSPKTYGACHWNKDFDVNGKLLPWASNAMVHGTVPLSLGFVEGGSDGSANSVVNGIARGEDVALEMVAPVCTNHGLFYKTIGAALPPCQESQSAIAGLDGWANYLTFGGFNDLMNGLVPGQHFDGAKHFCFCHGQNASATGDGCIFHWSLGDTIQQNETSAFGQSAAGTNRIRTVQNANPTAPGKAPAMEPMAPPQSLLGPKAWVGGVYGSYYPNCPDVANTK